MPDQDERQGFHDALFEAAFPNGPVGPKQQMLAWFARSLDELMRWRNEAEGMDRPAPYAVIEMTQLPDGPNGETQYRAEMRAGDGSTCRAERAHPKDAIDAVWLVWCERLRLMRGSADV